MNILGEDSDADINFSINESYAKRYDKWRQGEELQKLQDKYGNNVNKEFLSSEDEDEEEEDDNAEELTKDIEKEFLKTLSYLKEKNPKIYDQNVKFFKDNSIEKVPKREKKKKADCFYSVGEYQRNILIEKKGQFSDEEDKEKSFKELSNSEQQKALKESFKDVMKDIESESENENEDWGGLFKKRIKKVEELRKEEEDYRLWLAGEREKLENMDDEKDFRGLHDYWTNPKLDEGERFLRDYILNKRFLEKDESDRVPAYDEIVHDSDSGLSADENTLEKQEDFERKYNFRFEEPDQDFIKRYPRTLEHSMRKKDDRRKKHREEVKARKEAEKEKKVEELKRLKALKRKEIMEKIKKLQDITGNEDMAFQKNDLEEDFDPDKYDKRMSELFNENYYGVCEDKEKPEYPELDQDLEIENWDNWIPGENEEEELHCEDPGFNMDCDYNPNNKNNLEKELKESSKKRKKRRQSKFAAAIAKEKPIFDPKDKSFEKYIDEYYSLDYEDLIGDLPCRFKYRKVVPNDFGLSVEEILAAPDKELNSWVSIKKIMKRRPENVERYDVKAYKKKAKDFNKKKKCFPSLYENKIENSEDGEELDSAKEKIENKKVKSTNKNKLKANNKDVTTPNQKGKKFKNKCNDLLQNNFKVENTNMNLKNHSKMQPNFEQTLSKKKKMKLSGRKIEEQNKNLIHGISDKRLRLYGINPKKLKNKLKYGKKLGD